MLLCFSGVYTHCPDTHATVPQVVPETKLLPPSLFSIPESSPFRSDSEEEQTPRHITSKCPQEQDSSAQNKELEASNHEEHLETTEASSKVTFVQGACNRCKVLKCCNFFTPGFHTMILTHMISFFFIGSCWRVSMSSLRREHVLSWHRQRH